MPLLRVQYPLPFFEASAIVVPADAPDVIKRNARAFKNYYGDLVQLCDGVDDDVEINAAIAALPAGGGRVELLDGTFECADDIDGVDNLVLLGQGPSTIINFAGGCFFLLNVDNVELGNFNITGYTDHDGDVDSGAIWIYAHNANHENFYIHDISATVFGNGGWAAFYAYANNGVISNVLFERCYGLDCDGFGFFNSGEAGGYLKKFTYLNCEGNGNGIRATRQSDWVCGFEITELVDCEEFTYINCHSEGNWDNGFGAERDVFKKDLRFIGCSAINNAQIPVVVFGFGFGCSGEGTITFENCVARGNEIDFGVGIGDSESLTTLINCQSYDAVGTGLRIESGANGTVRVFGGRIQDSGGFGLFVYESKNVYIHGLEIINPTGVATVGNYIGQTDHGVEDSFFEIYATGTAAGIEFFCSDMVNVTLKGKIIAAATDSLLLEDCTNVRLVDLEMDTSGTRGINANGSDDVTVQGGHWEADGIAFYSLDSDDLMLSGVRIIATTPIVLNHANVVRPVIIGCNWKGSTNDPSTAAAVNPRISTNIDLNGAWFAGDNPG